MADFAFQDRPGNGRQNTAPVDGAQRGRCAAVRKTTECLEATYDDVAAWTTVDIRDEADAAAVVLGNRFV